jgi:hypothetical protein
LFLIFFQLIFNNRLAATRKSSSARHSADAGRRVRAKLKRIEAQLINTGLILCYNIQFFNE